MPRKDDNRLDNDDIALMAISTGAGAGMVSALLALQRFGTDNAVALGFGLAFFIAPVAFLVYRRLI